MKQTIPVYGISTFGGSEGKKDFFYSAELPQHLKSHRFVNAPHKHDTYIVVFFTNGSGTHQIDFENYPVKAGSIFLLNPGQVHCWELSEDADGYVFFHTKDFYNNTFLNRKLSDFPFFYLQQNRPVLYTDTKVRAKLELLFAQVHDEYKRQLAYSHAKIASLTDQLYIELNRLYDREAGDAKETGLPYHRVQMLQKLIDEHYKKLKYPKDYASMMHMSTRHLNRLCREVLNKTTGDLIQERIITEAKRLLIYSDNTVYMVADALGYDDHAYFIRFFKKVTGVTPKEFQKGVDRIQ